MPTLNNTTLKGIDHVGKLGISEIIRDNFIDFIDWGLIDNGGYFNIRIPTSGSYGGNYSKLRSAIDTRYNTGQVWEGFRKNWVWESGMRQGPEIRISGVNVNGSFYPSNTVGTYSHHIDYELGRVVFDNAIPTNSTVNAEYSVKSVQVFDLGKIPAFRQIHEGSFRVDDLTFFSSSGNWTIPSYNRVQLPAIGIVIGGKQQYKPLQIGGGQWKYNEVYSYILTEDDSMGLRLCDFISQQKEKGINLYDENRMASDNRKTFNYDGSLATGAMTYPNLVAPSSDGGYGYKVLYIRDSQVLSSQSINPNLFLGVIKFVTEITLDV